MPTIRLTDAQAHLIGLGPRPHKYRARRTIIDGIPFHSKGEAIEYCRLKLLQSAGQISGLECQPGYVIIVNGVKVCSVRFDFRFLNHDGKECVVDFKGYDTPESRLKRRLFEATHPGLAVEIRR